MKCFLLIPIFTPLAIAACVPLDIPTCGLPNEPVVIGKAKDGNLIYDDQAPLSAPCPIVTHSNASKPPMGIAQRPSDLPQPPAGKAKGNNGHGDGDQDAPGGSEPNNNAENRGGNHNGKNEAPGRSWHG